jgi:putative membrane protein
MTTGSCSLVLGLLGPLAIAGLRPGAPGVRVLRAALRSRRPRALLRLGASRSSSWRSPRPSASLARGYLFSAHMLQHLLLVLASRRSRSSDCPLPRPARGPPPPRVGRARVRSGPWLAAWARCGSGTRRRSATPRRRAPVGAGVQTVSLVVMGLAFWRPILAPREESRLPPLAGMALPLRGVRRVHILGILVTFSPVEVCSVYMHPVDRSA